MFVLCISLEVFGEETLTDSGKRDDVEVWGSPKLFLAKPGDNHLD